MVREELKLQIRERAYREGVFILSSGKRSSYYIDIKRAYTSPDVLENIAKAIGEELPEEYELLAGVAVGAVPIVAAVALEVHKPFLIVRREEKKHGTSLQVEGNFSPGQRAVMLEDVTTTGSSVLRAVEELRARGLRCNSAIAVVDREEGATENLKKEEVELIPLFKVSELKR